MITFVAAFIALNSIAGHRAERYADPTEIANLGTLSWVVKLTSTYSYASGVLISDRHILTSAHLFYEHNKSDCLKASFNNLRNPFTIKVKRYLLSPMSDMSKPQDERYDFAITELIEAIPLEEKGVSLPIIDQHTYSYFEVFNITNPVAAGYGDGKHLKIVLLTWDTSYSPNGDIGLYSLTYNGTLEGGDSGGPLYFLDNNDYILIGIGDSSFNKDGRPNFYEPISRYLSLIFSITNSSEQNSDSIKYNWTAITCVYDVAIVGAGVGVGITLVGIPFIIYAYKKLKKPD